MVTAPVAVATKVRPHPPAKHPRVHKPKPAPGRDLDKQLREIGDRAQRVLVAAVRIEVEGKRELAEIEQADPELKAEPIPSCPRCQHEARYHRGDRCEACGFYGLSCRWRPDSPPPVYLGFCDHPDAPGWKTCPWCWWAEVTRAGRVVLVAPA